MNDIRRNQIQIPPETAGGQLASDALAVRQQVGARSEGQIRCHHWSPPRTGTRKRHLPAESDEGPPRQKW